MSAKFRLFCNAISRALPSGKIGLGEICVSLLRGELLEKWSGVAGHCFARVAKQCPALQGIATA